MQVMEAMEHAVYNDEVQHIIIDNLQFMTTPHHRSSTGDSSDNTADSDGGESSKDSDTTASGTGTKGSADNATSNHDNNPTTSHNSSNSSSANANNEKFEVQDLAVERLRRFASEKDVSSSYCTVCV